MGRRKTKVKNLQYFKDFHADPKPYINKVFYEFIHEWIKYIKAHEKDFNYLEDDEWKEIRERLLEELDRREDLKDEFFELEEEIQAARDDDREYFLELQKKFVQFMKDNQFEFDFSDEQISEIQDHLESAIRAGEECKIAEEKLAKSKIVYEDSIADLDDSLFEHYQRTGKRPVLTSLRSKKKFTGN